MCVIFSLEQGVNILPKLLNASKGSKLRVVHYSVPKLMLIQLPDRGHCVQRDNILHTRVICTLRIVFFISFEIPHPTAKVLLGCSRRLSLRNLLVLEASDERHRKRDFDLGLAQRF